MSVKHYPLVIVGAGESGIAMACQLKMKLGLGDFRIFDRQGGLGGTWYINKYPGVACDIPALFYSFSFFPNYQWTSFFPPGAEILAYLESVAQNFGIIDKIDLHTEVSQARWLETECLWELTVVHLAKGTGDLSEVDKQSRIQQHGQQSVCLSTEIVHAKVLVSCVGGLVEPKSWPTNIPGIDEFRGDVFHSARWDPKVSLADKNVMVIGTGCSAAQFVPRLTKPPYNAKSVTQLMRSPPWVFPRPQTPELWRKHSPKILGTVPGIGRVLRFLLFLGAEANWLLFGISAASAKRRVRFEGKLRKHLKQAVSKKYQRMLEPSYSVGCKRIIIDDAWLKCLGEDSHELTTRPLLSVQTNSVTLGASPDSESYTEDEDAVALSKSSIHLPVDIIILANGFDTSSYLHRMSVLNDAKESLRDIWSARGGPQAYLGTAFDGFPNFFLVLGPNTLSGHSSAILASENLISYALNFIGPILKDEIESVRVKRSAVDLYTEDVQRRSKTKVWSECGSWYTTDSGWNSSVCPYVLIPFHYTDENSRPVIATRKSRSP